MSLEQGPDSTVRVSDVAQTLRMFAHASDPRERRELLSDLYGFAFRDRSTPHDDRAAAALQSLRIAVSQLEDVHFRDAATALLPPHVLSSVPFKVRRARAADALGYAVDTFRRRYEDALLHEVALNLVRIDDEESSRGWVRAAQPDHVAAAKEAALADTMRSLLPGLAAVNSGVITVGDTVLVKSRRDDGSLFLLAVSTTESQRRQLTAEVMSDPDSVLALLVNAEDAFGGNMDRRQALDLAVIEALPYERRRGACTEPGRAETEVE